MADAVNPDLLIEIDGGVTLDNCAKLYQAGANVLVAGSTVFNSDNPSETIEKLHSNCANGAIMV